MTSLFYKSSFLYNFMLNFIHKDFLKKRYELISKIIGKNKKVLEVGCGTSLIKHFLDKSVDYEGWDLNKKFIIDSKKKGLNVKLKSAFDYKSYPKVDVILIVDFLHHIAPRHEELLKMIRKNAKRIIIIEPFILRSSFRYRLKKLNNPLLNLSMLTLINLFGDNDGINKHEVLCEWNYSKESLKKFFKNNGAKKIFGLGKDLIAVI